MKKMQLLNTVIFVICIIISSNAQELKPAINWETFLSRSDLVWTEMPAGWTEGAFTGNGLLGTIFWQKDNSLYFEISRTDAYDHRNNTSIHTGRYRMPNGNFILHYKGNSPKGSMRLDLWNAEVRGAITTSAGKLNFRTFTHASSDVILLEIDSREGEAFNLTWHADTCQTPRKQARSQKGAKAYPPQVAKIINGTNVSIQEMPEDAA